MNYQDLKNQMPDAIHMYCDVTAEEAEAIGQEHWRIPVGTLFCVGTEEPEDSLNHRAVSNDSVPE